MQTRVVVMMMIALLASPHAQREGTPADVRLRAAMDVETVQGNLEWAIAEYTAIADDRFAPKAIRGEATLRLGIAFERARRPDAARYYEWVVNQYSETPGLAAVASARLAALASSGAVKQTTKRLCSGGDCSGGAVSPNGQMVLLTGGMTVRYLRTDAVRPVEGAPAGARGLVWSPDGRQIAFQSESDGTGQGQTGIVNLAGGRPRTVHSGSYPVAWSSDGDRLLVVAGNGDDQRLVWVRIADRSEERLPYRGEIRRAVPSPNGRLIAFSTTPESRLRVMRSDGTQEALAWPATTTQAPVAWTSDSRLLLFSQASRTNARSTELWALRFDGDKPHGSPELLQQFDSVPTFLGLDNSGALYYRRLKPDSTEIYESVLDDGKGQLSAPAPVPLPTANNVLPKYSPADGRQLAYVHVDAGRGATIPMLFSFDTGRPLPLPTSVLASRGAVCWGTRGDSLIYLADPAPQQPPSLDPGATSPWLAEWATPLVERDLKTGVERTLRDASLYLLTGCAAPLLVGMDLVVPPVGPFCSDDRLCGSNLRIHRSDNGEDRQIHRFERRQVVPFASPQVSHDGKTVSFLERLDAQQVALRTIPTGGGAVRELVRGPGLGCRAYGHTWSPDDRFIYYCQSDGETAEVHRISVESRTTQSTGLKGRLFGNLTISPDGRRMSSVWGALDAREPEIFVLENFLPASDRAGVRPRKLQPKR